MSFKFWNVPSTGISISCDLDLMKSNFNTYLFCNLMFVISCEDINECLNPLLNDCDDSVRASCVNTEGSYSCSCRSGFTGDGKFCVYVSLI